MENKEKIFTNIFNKNGWGDNESVSGFGSRLENTRNLRYELEYLIKVLNIKSIIDAPCGDMNWMSHVNLNDIKYYGFDIVDDLIKQNKEKFKNDKNFTFEKKDAIVDHLPKSDLILCRDLIIHFPVMEIWKLLCNFCKSESKYLLITHDSTVKDENTNINFGQCARRNLTIKPFNFPRPLFMIPDHDIESNGLFFMGLYRLKDIKSYIKINNKKMN